MKLLMISALVAIVLLAAATSMLRSHAPDRVGTPGMPSTQELQRAVDTNKLPIEEFEDQSLVYSRVPKP